MLIALVDSHLYPDNTTKKIGKSVFLKDLGSLSVAQSIAAGWWEKKDTF